jgi:SAM-dependent methyltransferase
VCGGSGCTTITTGTDYQYATTDQSFDWCRCPDCGHLRIDPIPTEAALETIYPDDLMNYAEFDEQPGLAFRVKAFFDGRRLRALSAGVPAGGRLLDVGCAAGMLLDVARQSCPNLEVLDGLEISAAAAAGAIGKGYHVTISTIEAADLPADYYDLITMQQVIEHVHDPRAVLAKLRAALRPGGRLVMDTPNLGSLDQRVFNRRGYWEGYHIPRHFNLWTPAGMQRIVTEAGFASMTTKKRIKPVHWTLSLQNWAIGTRKPRWLIRFFDLRNPLLLAVFGVVDLAQLVLFGKASDVQYVATR